MKELYIGDHVMSLQFQKSGVIEDKLFSNKQDDWMYIVKFDDSKTPFMKPLSGNDLEYINNKEYRFEVFQADNVMVAVMYEVDGDQER